MNFSVMKRPIQYILVFILCIASYLFLLVSTNLIPFQSIETHLRESSETLITENEKQIINLPLKDEMLFYYTDVIILNMIASVDSAHPFESALLSRKGYQPGVEQEHITTPSVSIPGNPKYLVPDINCLIREFYGMMHGDSLDFSWEYARYWHGHGALLRPLFLIFNLEQIRIFLWFAMILLGSIFLFFTIKKLGPFIGIAFAISLATIPLLTLTRSINESLLFLFIFASMIYLLFAYRKEKKFGIYFFVIGSIINFFDFLTSPILGLFFPLALLLLFRIKEDRHCGKALMREFICSCFLWLLGYGLTWLTKWIIVDLVFDRNIFLQALSQIGTRSTSLSFTYLAVLERILLFFNPKVLSISLFAIFVLGSIGLFVYRKQQRNNILFLSCSIPFILMFFVPFIWCLLIKNHAYLHPFYTYRLFSLSILSFAVIILLFVGSIIQSKKENSLQDNQTKERKD